MCVYGGAHMHAFRSRGFTSGPAWCFCEWLCVPQVPHTSDLEVFLWMSWALFFLTAGAPSSSSLLKRQAAILPPRPWVLHGLCLWKRAFCKPQSWFSFSFLRSGEGFRIHRKWIHHLIFIVLHSGKFPKAIALSSWASWIGLARETAPGKQMVTVFVWEREREKSIGEL